MIARDLVEFDLDRARAIYRTRFAGLIQEILSPGEAWRVEGLTLCALEHRFRDDDVSRVERLYEQSRGTDYEVSAALLIRGRLRDVPPPERRRRAHAVAVHLAFARVRAGDADFDAALDEVKEIVAAVAGGREERNAA